MDLLFYKIELINRQAKQLRMAGMMDQYYMMLETIAEEIRIQKNKDLNKVKTFKLSDRKLP